ncbi:MAG TPA: hypothetical protein DCS93_15270 [Microscillaceae bacterium]|nr:hypothetical protein [Microscillaceae bacterium]
MTSENPPTQGSNESRPKLYWILIGLGVLITASVGLVKILKTPSTTQIKKTITGRVLLVKDSEDTEGIPLIRGEIKVIGQQYTNARGPIKNGLFTIAEIKHNKKESKIIQFIIKKNPCENCPIHTVQLPIDFNLEMSTIDLGDIPVPRSKFYKKKDTISQINNKKRDTVQIVQTVISQTQSSKRGSNQDQIKLKQPKKEIILELNIYSLIQASTNNQQISFWVKNKSVYNGWKKYPVFDKPESNNKLLKLYPGLNDIKMLRGQDTCKNFMIDRQPNEVYLITACEN